MLLSYNNGSARRFPTGSFATKQMHTHTHTKHPRQKNHCKSNIVNVYHRVSSGHTAMYLVFIATRKI